MKKIFAILALFAFAIGIAPTTVVTPAQAFLPKIDAGKPVPKSVCGFKKLNQAAKKPCSGYLILKWVNLSVTALRPPKTV